MSEAEKVLVVVDMQNDFVDGSLGSLQAKSIVSLVKAKIRQYAEDGHTVIFTRDTHGDDYLETQEGAMLPVKHCVASTPGWEIVEGLCPEEAMIWDKNAFGSPELAMYMKEKAKVEEIELIGLCTDICVVSNALILKAFLPETKITVDASCCAGITEESHNAALLTMKMCQIHVIHEKTMP